MRCCTALDVPLVSQMLWNPDPYLNMEEIILNFVVYSKPHTNTDMGKLS